MPERGVGKALRKALAGEREEAVKPGAEALLLNKHRREVFQQLCLKPCATPGAVARALGISPNAVAWHLQKLEEAGFLARAGADAAFPAGLIAATDVGIFLLLAKEAIRAALVAVMNEPGSSLESVATASGSTRQTASRALVVLERDGLVSVVRDGRANRYFPTDLLAQRREGNAKRALAFSEAVLVRLRGEGVRPQVVRRTAQEFMVLLGERPASPFLHLRTDPFTTVLG